MDVEKEKKEQERYLDQKNHNFISRLIAIASLIIALLAFFKEFLIYDSELSYYTGNVITLSHSFGNVSQTISVNFINSGEKATILNKIEAEILDADGIIKYPRKSLNIQNSTTNIFQNSITLIPKSEITVFLYYNILDILDPNINSKFNTLQYQALDDLKAKGCTVENNVKDGKTIEICDSIFKRMKEICLHNFSNFKMGNYKIIYYVYENNSKTPSIVFGKSFSINEKNINELEKSFENYKNGVSLVRTNQILYPSQSISNCSDISNEEIKQIQQKIK